MIDVEEDPRIPAVALRGLRKVFQDNVAVDSISLDIPRGAFYGVVGPNGAGKTTCLSMATGLLRPDAGEAYIAGHNTWTEPDAVRRAMGLLIDDAPYFDRLSGAEILAYTGGLRGMEPGVIAQRGEELLDALGLIEAGDTPIGGYSAGMTKKILLAVAMLHNPEVLILDEPLESVDPVSSKLIQDLLRAYVRAGGTVVISSHVMELIEGLCDYVAIIDRGTVRVAGHVDEVRGGRRLSDVFVDLVGGATLKEGSFSWLGGRANE